MPGLGEMTLLPPGRLPKRKLTPNPPPARLLVPELPRVLHQERSTQPARQEWLIAPVSFRPSVAPRVLRCGLPSLRASFQLPAVHPHLQTPTGSALQRLPRSHSERGRQALAPAVNFCAPGLPCPDRGLGRP